VADPITLKLSDQELFDRIRRHLGDRGGVRLRFKRGYRYAARGATTRLGCAKGVGQNPPARRFPRIRRAPSGLAAGSSRRGLV
jgi:hypothetical protein